MPSRFKAAIFSAAYFARSRWYWVIPFALWELVKDRLANWANEKIDQNAGAVMKEIVRLVEWTAGQPFFWTLIVVVIVLVVVFLHAYITDEKLKSSAAKAGGEVNAVRNGIYDLRVSLHNPTGKTIKNASASLEAVEPEIEDADRWINVQRLFGMPLRPEGRRNPHVPTPTHIDIHPDDTGIFDVGRVNFVHEKKHIAVSIAETNPVQDGQGRTFYTHGVDRGIHFPQEGLCTFTVVVRGEDIKPERVAFKVDVKQARVWKE